MFRPTNVPLPLPPFCSSTPLNVMHLGREPPAYHARRGRVRARTMGPAKRSALRAKAAPRATWRARRMAPLDSRNDRRGG